MTALIPIGVPLLYTYLLQWAYRARLVVYARLETDAHGLRDRTHVVTPAYRLNRDDDGATDRCDFVLHLWGASDAAREAAFAQVCAGRRPAGLGIELPNFAVAGCEPPEEEEAALGVAV